MIFPRALGYVDEAVSDLFDRLDKGVTPVPAILAETFRYLNACGWAGEGRFIGCAQLLLAWFHSHFWKTCQMKRLAVGSMTTPEYSGWWSKRINDNIPEPHLEGVRPMEEYLQLEEEKRHLRLDAGVQKLEAKKLRKGKNKAKEDLDSLKTNYKKLHLSIRTAGLGKTSEQWPQEIQEERNIADRWERKFHEAKYTNCNSAVELRASLNKIEEMKGNIEELESALKSCELRVELLEVNEERWKEQLHHSHNQIRNIDYIMGMNVAQIWELTQLLAEGVDKGKGPMANPGEDSEDSLYPSGFTPPNLQTEAEIYPRRPSSQLGLNNFRPMFQCQ
ncbi:hypothetical protein Golax_025690 [Gossypium laxum]|uniref:DUF7745 domain-containing protein n=1 Tax=Gossypium laxum TaxID=34288 RepID=A0A7J9B309_9ROSI|nr:hypothetical protein [Gossypium laxum]